MDNHSFKYTDDELVDFGWDQIKDQLPKKKRRRAIWLWLPAAALFLGALYFGNQLLDKKQSTTQSSTHDVMKSNLESGQVNNKVSEKDNPSHIRLLPEAYNQVEKEVREEQRIVKIDDQNRTKVIAQETNAEQQVQIYEHSTSTGKQLERLHSQQLNGENPQNQIEMVSVETIKHEQPVIQENSIKEMLDNMVPVCGITNPFSPINRVETEDVKKKLVPTKPVFVENESTKAVVEKEEENLLLSTIKTTDVAKPKRVQAYVGGQFITNQIQYFGGGVQAGAVYHLTDKKQISAGLQASLMQDHLQNFTTFQPVGGYSLNADSSDPDKNMIYEVFLIEAPVTFQQAVSEKWKLNGGVILNFADFTDFYERVDTTGQAEKFLVQSAPVVGRSNSNYQPDPNQVNDFSNYYKISDEFVEQFHQFSVGFTAGGAYELKPNFDVDFSTTFALQALKKKDFMEYQPFLAKIGAKYYFFKRN